MMMEESSLDLHQLAEEFLAEIASPFRAAAHELEFEKVFIAHARLAHTTLGQDALIIELTPKTDAIAIDRSLAEIREARLVLTSGEGPSFSGVSDLSATLRKLEIAGSTMYPEEASRALHTMKGMR